MEDVVNYWNTFIEMVISYVPKIIGGIAIIVIGFWVVKRLMKLLRRTLERSHFNPEITTFLISASNIVLRVLVLLIAAAVFGVDVTSLVAILAAAGFAVGLALQGSLGNFAAGIIILVFRPYRVGDWIDVDDKFGKVEEIQIFNTLVVTPGRKTLIVPNGQIVDNIVTNYSIKGYIRMELNVTMPYDESFPKVKAIILDVLHDIPYVLEDPTPEVGIESYDSHSVLLAVRPYVEPDHFWEVTFQAYEGIKKAFYESNIKVAYSEGVEMGNIGE